MQNKDVFELIRRFELYDVISKLIIPLIQLDRERAFKILLDKNKIKPEVVVHQLEQNQEYLYLVSKRHKAEPIYSKLNYTFFQYLDALDKISSQGTFHQRLVALYAKYDRSKLLPFLRRSNDYVIQEALAICKREEFHPEMVYLLGRMGSIVEALNIIIHSVCIYLRLTQFCLINFFTDKRH